MPVGLTNISVVVVIVGNGLQIMIGAYRVRTNEWNKSLEFGWICGVCGQSAEFLLS